MRVLARGQSLIPPKINPKVQEVVYEALLEDKKLEFRYRPKGEREPKDYELNSLGIVIRDGGGLPDRHLLGVHGRSPVRLTPSSGSHALGQAIIETEALRPGWLHCGRGVRVSGE